MSDVTDIENETLYDEKNGIDNMKNMMRVSFNAYHRIQFK